LGNVSATTFSSQWLMKENCVPVVRYEGRPESHPLNLFWIPQTIQINEESDGELHCLLVAYEARSSFLSLMMNCSRNRSSFVKSWESSLNI